MLHATPQDFGLHDIVLAGLLGPAVFLARLGGVWLSSRLRRRARAAR
jgi:hypothetical protein